MHTPNLCTSKEQKLTDAKLYEEAVCEPFNYLSIRAGDKVHTHARTHTRTHKHTHSCPTSLHCATFYIHSQSYYPIHIPGPGHPILLL